MFPSEWKLCIVSSIFKNGDRSVVSNYRLICKQNVMAKIFENIVATKLSSLLKNIIIGEQHGFVKGRSVTTNLVLYHDYTCNAVERGEQVYSIYTDVRKAFGSVNHALLAGKLRAMGINGALLLWLSSFFSNRRQILNIRVSCQGKLV